MDKFIENSLLYYVANNCDIDYKPKVRENLKDLESRGLVKDLDPTFGMSDSKRPMKFTITRRGIGKLVSSGFRIRWAAFDPFTGKRRPGLYKRYRDALRADKKKVRELNGIHDNKMKLGTIRRVVLTPDELEGSK